MPSGAQLRDPWSKADLNFSADALQFRRNTSAALNTLNPLLAPGEPAWEIDTKKGKLGDGVTRYQSLPYSIGVVGSALTLPANSVAVNNTGTSAAAVGVDLATFRTFADVPRKTTDFDPLNNAYSAHAADVAAQVKTLTVTTVNGSPTVTVATALPADVTASQPITGPGIADYSYIFNIAANRLSFQLSSNALSYVAAPAGAGAGTGTASYRIVVNGAHGITWSAYPQINPLNFQATGYSSPIAMGNTFTTREKWSEGWYKGEKWMHSFEYPVAQRIFPLQESIASHVVAPVPSAFQVWSPFPTTTPWDFMEPNSTNVGRYKAYVPLESATQARIVVDWMAAGATAGSGAKLKAQYAVFPGPTWADLAENSPASTIEVAIDTGVGMKIGSWGVIDNAAIAAAAAGQDLLLLRVVGFAATAAGSPSFGTVRIQLK